MDKGRPFRVPQPADRRVISKPEPMHRQPEAVHMSEAPTAAPAATYPETAPLTSRRAVKAPKAPKRRLLWPIIAGIIVVLAAVGWFVLSNMQNNQTAIDSSKYQAVFFTNGQVYFGKLHSFNSDYLKLNDIYYLQTQTGSASKNPQETSTDQSNVQLIKLGNEVHGPEDQMIIAKDQVLFYENLKPDGKVAQSISKYKAPN